MTSIKAVEFAKILIKLSPKRFDQTNYVDYYESNEKLENVPRKGNLILNKYLHIAQMIFWGWKKKPLFQDQIVCFLNGGVVLQVYKEWKEIVKDSVIEKKNEELYAFAEFLINEFGRLNTRELIELSHLDPAWMAKESQIWELKEKNVIEMKPYIESYQKLFVEEIEKLNSIEE